MKHVPVTPLRVHGQRTICDNVLTHFSQPQNFEIQSHAHPCAILTIVLRGSFFESVDGSVHHCEPGTILMKPAAAVHRHKYSPDGAECLLIELARLDFPSVDFIQGFTLGAALFQEFQTSDQAAEITVSEFLFNVRSMHREGFRTMESRHLPPWLQTAMEYMKDRARDPIGLTEIARAAGVHPAHLSEVFPKFNRCTAGEYLRSLRLNWAVQEITGSQRSIVDIALEAGFYDQSHFYRFFKKHTGLNPMQMRKQAGHICA